MSAKFKVIALIFLSLAFLASAVQALDKPIVVGSKKFPESYILAEIMAQLLEEEGFQVKRNLGLGGTTIAYEALKNGDIDIYPEYSGTISQAILKIDRKMSFGEINQSLSSQSLRLLDSFGFNNTYAIAVSEHVQKKYFLENIGDLRGKKLKGAITHEFLKRKDGWDPLTNFYGIKDVETQGIEHSLAFEAVKAGSADLMDVYSTDAKIEKFNLILLKDEKEFFPAYMAAAFIREELPLKVVKVLDRLSGQIDEKQMIALNAQAVLEKKSFAEVAENFLIERGFKKKAEVKKGWSLSLLLKYLGQHLYLTAIPIFMAVLVAVPLAIALQKYKAIAQPIMTVAGLLQTIPSLALLVFMIPYFGTGVLPALVALFLYSILPILRSTYTALKNIDPVLLDAAKGIGLYKSEVLFLVQVPLALPIIIAGIRIAAIMNIGLATIAAFIGAGGLGEPIVTGLSLNDTNMILQGAIPAAALAILTEVIFEKIEKAITP